MQRGVHEVHVMTAGRKMDWFPSDVSGIRTDACHDVRARCATTRDGLHVLLRES